MYQEYSVLSLDRPSPTVCRAGLWGLGSGQLYVLFFVFCFFFSSSAFAAYLVCIRHLLYLLQDLLCSLRDFLDDFSRLARFWRLKEEEGKHGH